MKNFNYYLIIPVILSIALSVAFYPLLPDTIASHWDAYGNADGYSGKLGNVIFFPILITFITALLVIVPKFDPKKANIEKFMPSYNLFIVAFAVFMLLLQLQVMLWNIDIKISMNVAMPIMMGLLFITIGNMLKNAKQNFMIGIRTPWTLQSEAVWDKTHKVGAKLFMIAGIVSVFSALLGDYSFFVMMGAILLSAFGTLAYSYYFYTKLSK